MTHSPPFVGLAFFTVLATTHWKDTTPALFRASSSDALTLCESFLVPSLYQTSNRPPYCCHFFINNAFLINSSHFLYSFSTVPINLCIVSFSLPISKYPLMCGPANCFAHSIVTCKLATVLTWRVFQCNWRHMVIIN